MNKSTINDEKVLAVARSVQRNRLHFRHLLHQQFASQQTTNAFYKWIRELLQLDVFRAHKAQIIPKAKTYLTLGERGCRIVGAKRRLIEPVAEQDLAYEIGCLAYTSMGKPYRKRLLPEELRKSYSFISERHLRWAWLVEFFEKKRVLSTLRIEHVAGIDRILGKLHHQLDTYREEPEFSHLVEQGQVMIVLVVATKNKALALERAFREQPGFITPALDKVWEAGKQGHVRIKPVYYPPLLRFEA